MSFGKSFDLLENVTFFAENLFNNKTNFVTVVATISLAFFVRINKYVKRTFFYY